MKICSACNTEFEHDHEHVCHRPPEGTVAQAGLSAHGQAVPTNGLGGGALGGGQTAGQTPDWFGPIQPHPARGPEGPRHRYQHPDHVAPVWPQQPIVPSQPAPPPPPQASFPQQQQDQFPQQQPPPLPQPAPPPFPQQQQDQFPQQQPPPLPQQQQDQFPQTQPPPLPQQQSTPFQQPQQSLFAQQQSLVGQQQSIFVQQQTAFPHQQPLQQPQPPAYQQAPEDSVQAPAHQGAPAQTTEAHDTGQSAHPFLRQAPLQAQQLLPEQSQKFQEFQKSQYSSPASPEQVRRSQQMERLRQQQAARQEVIPPQPASNPYLEAEARFHADAQAAETTPPDTVASPSQEIRLLDQPEDLAEETLDMRFHIEKHQDPNVGLVIAGRYKIVSLVGRGGMGVVYKAEYVNIDRTVAIKMLHPHIVADADIVRRFQQEAQAVSRVEHQHCVRIYDFGMTEMGQPFIVMDFVEGGSLREVIQSEGLVPIPRAADIFNQVFDALSCAHQAGVIHRDMKPENIMLTEKSGKDWVYVVDFGISTLASAADRSRHEPRKKDTIGSPAYMSPEQCTKGAEVDHRSDIYSLAVALYETLSGKLPYQARNAFELLDAHVNAQPIPLMSAHPSLTAYEATTAVLLQAMEKQPDKRQQTVDELAADLTEAFKRDSIRSNYLKNRKETLLSSSTEIPAYDPAVEAAADAADESALVHRRQFGSYPVEPSSFIKKLLNVITLHKDRRTGSDQPDNRVMFANCPRCNEPVEPGISFCLSCGRSLATTHEFAKIRAASGIFALPRSQETSSTMPVVTQKLRVADSGWFARLKLPLLLLAIAGGVGAAVVTGAAQPVVDAVMHMVQR